MDRRQFIALASSAIVAPEVSASTPKPPSSKRPNFLFLIADDLNYRSIGKTNKEMHTPNIDRLIREGCYFSHCFHQGSWTGAICVASRTMLNTGLASFQAQTAIHPDRAPYIPMWGETLRNHGYHTYTTGKWHLDAVSHARSFEEHLTVGPGFLPSFPEAPSYNRPSPGNTWNPADTSLDGHWLHTAAWQNTPQDSIKHSSEVYADSIVDFLQRQRGHHDKPFFAYVGFNAPHDPRQAPQSYLDQYPVDKIALPENFLPEHPFDIGLSNERDETLAPFPRTPEAVRLHRREYYAIITHMDAQIGRILDALDRSGQADNTYVILTADHGLQVGEHGILGKTCLYESSVRMPLVVRGPGIRAGKQVDEMVYQHGMYATTCEIAGVPLPKHVAFPSFAPMLREEQPKPMYDAMFCWFRKVQRSVRTRDHKLIYYPAINRYQLFDLNADPWELHDLSDDPAHASTKETLRNRLHALQVELDDPILKQDDKPKKKKKAARNS